jgi:hypothetical protein
MTKRVVKSACRMRHGVCRVLDHLEGDKVVKVSGDSESPRRHRAIQGIHQHGRYGF